METIAVLGAGNGGCSVAASLALRGFRVILSNRSEERLAPLQARGGIELTGVAENGLAKLENITHDIAQAVRDADIIIVVVPTMALPYYARAMAPAIRPEHVFLLNPGHTGGGLYLATLLRELGVSGVPRVCETATLTHASRMTGQATADVRLIVRNMPFSAFPGKYRDELLDHLLRLFPTLVPAASVLETALMNINAMEHPVQALCNVGWLEHTRGEYLFYYEGTTPAVGRLIDAVDRERMCIARTLGFQAKDFCQIFYEFGFTTEEGLRGGTAYAAMQHSGPNRWTKGPKTGLDHRYTHEDVGHGLVPLSALARVVNVDTPIMDSLITLASTMNLRDYRSEGLTLKKMGLEGIRPDALAEFFWKGCT